ncbi:MAG: methyltransferase, partial [Planctomycetes bacterium]|nr:methyltransferase [Planctomycetota bacterium]
ASRGKFFLESIDLSDRKRLLDVGGGPGSYSIAACKKYKHLNAVVFDLKETTEIAKEVIASENLSDRITTTVGNWDVDEFGTGYDVVIMSNILHGIFDEASMKLRKAYNALEPDGILAVQEFLLDDKKDGPVVAALFNMMVGAFSQSELLDVITQAGFVDAKIVSVNESIGSDWATARRPK